tara:strand:+ start:186 stop:590 length:405 start_codon:yes stop_codon:yes gene_type:complete
MENRMRVPDWREVKETREVYNFTVNHRQVSTNSGYRTSKRGMYKTKELNAFQQAIRDAAQEMWGDTEPDKDSKWCVDIVYYYPSARNDIDGALKPTLDAMEGIVYVNDSQVVMLSVEKKKDKDDPRTEIVLRRQ